MAEQFARIIGTRTEDEYMEWIVVCPGCEKASFVWYGDTEDISMSAPEAVKCCFCGHESLISPEDGGSCESLDETDPWDSYENSRLDKHTEAK